MSFMLLFLLLLIGILFVKTQQITVGKVFFTLCLGFAMGTQWVLLWLDRQFSIATAMPLHLCGWMALLCTALLWTRWQTMWELCTFVGIPTALLALLFPAVAQSSSQSLMTFAFVLLHASIVCVPVFLCLCGKHLPTDPRRAMFWLNVFLLFVSVFNALFETNYLFLRYAPMGTPLAFFKARGNGFYIVSLEMLCLLTTAGLSALYQQKPIAKSS